MRTTKVVVGLLVVAALAGCGGGEAPRPGAASTASSAPAQPSRDPAAPVPQPLVFTAKTVDGEQFRAESVAGKPVVLWFWAPWCPKCRAGAPGVEAAAKQYGDAVTVIGVGGLGGTPEMKTFVRDAGLTFVNLADESGTLWRKFGVTTQHTFVLLDADGIVVYRGGLTGGDLDRRVGELAG